MALIQCRDLSLAYDGRVVESGVSFTVPQGDYLCIVGENGSGKSTLMKALLGLIRPASGSITFGEGLHQTEIGYLPQQTQIQRDFPASCFEVVLSGRLNRRKGRFFYHKADRDAARRAMDTLGIGDLARRCYHDLSGGQQQRVLLARALCATQKLLLLDEPVAGLDPVVTQELYALIRRLNDEGLTVIMVSHDMTAVAEDAKHVLHLAHKPLFYGNTFDYLHSGVGRRFTGRDGNALF